MVVNDKFLSFDDVLIAPRFSSVSSRKNVSLTQNFLGVKLDLPIISSNMDTVTNSNMADAMSDNGAISALHRFMSIEDNITEFKKCKQKPIVSVGLGSKELERAIALYENGAEIILVDVAHGASMGVVNHVKELRSTLGNNFNLIVGNFADSRSIKDFLYYLGSNKYVNSYKVGIGGGSACLTRVVTGCGLPTFGSILDCSTLNISIIADGGCRNSGDIAKALAAGASTVMLGGMLAGTQESPGDIYYKNANGTILKDNEFLAKKLNSNGTYDLVEDQHSKMFPKFKSYRGSASTESYQVQGKIAKHRSYEGDSFLVPYKGSVSEVLQQIEGGLRSALSYVGATNLNEFREFVEFVEISVNGMKESNSHGRRNE
jgi:IMP dehydrogenase